MEQNRVDLSAWVETIKGYADIKELDRIILAELIEKITVGEAKIVDGEKVIDVAIYYRFIGAIEQMAI